MGNFYDLSTPRPLKSGINLGVGAYLAPYQPMRISSLGYSFTDSASKLGTVAGTILQSRVVVLRGRFTAFDVGLFGGNNLFTGTNAGGTNPAYDPTTAGNDVVFDAWINDVGPGYVPLPDDVTHVIEQGQGVSILLATPYTNQTGTALISNLNFGAVIGRGAYSGGSVGGVDPTQAAAVATAAQNNQTPTKPPYRRG